MSLAHNSTTMPIIPWGTVKDSKTTTRTMLAHIAICLELTRVESSWTQLRIKRTYRHTPAPMFRYRHDGQRSTDNSPGRNIQVLNIVEIGDKVPDTSRQ